MAAGGGAGAGAELGVFGGSGFYAFLDGCEEVEVDTPYGPPSAPVALGEVAGRRVAFLARHGHGHRFPAHKVNYRANVWALHSLGVRAVIGPCAAGSLQRHIEPGHFVVCDQLVDRTWGRADTFHDGPDTVHTAFADPYDEGLRRLLLDTAADLGFTAHDGGTMVVVQGPRFSTRAESRWFREQGWAVVGMTQHPEAFLCRELGLRYATVALVTDYDSGVEDDPTIEPVTMEAVLAVMEANVGRVRDLLLAALPAI